VVILRKIPPSPGYLVFFTGAALLMFGLLIFLGRAERAQGLLKWLATIGQVSLFVFVLQYFVFWTLPDLLGIKPDHYFPLLFAGQIALLWLVALWWGRIGGNRWMRVGLRSRTASTTG
jgi:fucose 4-O-acetylase-like acetyltransferase